MRILHQSPSLREVFKKQVDQRIAENRQAALDALGDGLFASVGTFFFELNQLGNQVKGSIGESVVALLLKFLPDTWVMFNNALIPAAKSGTLTEIDHLIIGTGGVFLVEVKTWKGSFSAYKDKWKRRDGNNWIAIPNSPSSQSIYHQKMFEQWIFSEIPSLPDNFIAAPVVFSVAKWLGVKDCSVPVLHGVNALLQMLTSSSNCLTPEQVRQISNAVEDYTIPVATVSPPVSAPQPKAKPILKREKSDNKTVPSREVTGATNSSPEGVEVERQAIADVTAWLQSLPQTLEVRNVEDDSAYQQVNVDLLLTTTNGRYKLKVKGDRWHETSNFFFETHGNSEGGIASCFTSTQADWLCYYFVIPRLLYLLPLPAAGDWFAANINRFQERSIAVSRKGSDRHSTLAGRLVAIATLLQEVEAVRKIQL